jgi:hypothetical protein
MLRVSSKSPRSVGDAEALVEAEKQAKKTEGGREWRRSSSSGAKNGRSLSTRGEDRRRRKGAYARVSGQHIRRAAKRGCLISSHHDLPRSAPRRGHVNVVIAHEPRGGLAPTTAPARRKRLQIGRSPYSAPVDHHRRRHNMRASIVITSGNDTRGACRSDANRRDEVNVAADFDAMDAVNRSIGRARRACPRSWALEGWPATVRGDGDGDGAGDALRSSPWCGRLLDSSAGVAWRWCSCASASDRGRGEVGDEARAGEARGEGGADGRSPLSAPWLRYKVARESVCNESRRRRQNAVGEQRPERRRAKVEERKALNADT